ncbi:MAG TPA: hypothetical protein VMT03_13190 [Polyangia bacterium]|nr:hypothetical protein [Polyangia bacterium]
MRRRVAAAFVLATLAGGISAARADDALPERQAGLSVRQGRLVVSVGLQDLFGEAERQRLKSGFSTRVLVRAAVEDAASGEVVSLAVWHGEILYDIWDEKFAVRTVSNAAPEQRAVVATAGEAIARTTALIDFPVAELARLQPGARYVVAFRGDLNPISQDLLAEVRRWLVQPSRGQRRLAAGDSFFGSFVSIFVNPRIEDSERQVRFVSQPFAAPPPTPPPSAPPPPRRSP